NPRRVQAPWPGLHDRSARSIPRRVRRFPPRPQDTLTNELLCRQNVSPLASNEGGRRRSPNLRLGLESTTPCAGGTRSIEAVVVGRRRHAETVQVGTRSHRRRATLQRHSLRTRTICSVVA